MIGIGFVAGVLLVKWKEFKIYLKMARDATEVTKNIKELRKQFEKQQGEKPNGKEDQTIDIK